LAYVNAASAQTSTATLNLEGWGNSAVTVATPSFNLPDLTSVNWIEITLAHTFAADIDFTLAGPGGAFFDITTDNGGANDLGNAPNGGGLLTNLATYRFVASGGADGTWNSDVSLLGGGTYNSESWGIGPFVAGTWTFTLADDLIADTGSVGAISINYSAVPEPSALALAGLLGICGVGAVRRRVRSN
jgi:hypothetical protein